MEEKKYTKDGLTVIWKPKKCLHSGICFRGLGRVFNPRLRPWINLDAADQESIIRQVKECPSGALSYSLEEPTKEIKEATMENKENTTRISVSDKGPYLVSGKFLFVDKDGNEEIKEGKMALCRCGLSKNKPFCDGTHKSSDVLNA